MRAIDDRRMTRGQRKREREI